MHSRLLKIKEIAKAASLPATQICLKVEYGGRSPKNIPSFLGTKFGLWTFLTRSFTNYGNFSNKSYNCFHKYVKYIDFYDDFSMNYLAKFIEKC